MRFVEQNEVEQIRRRRRDALVTGTCAIGRYDDDVVGAERLPRFRGLNSGFQFQQIWFCHVIRQHPGRLKRLQLPEVVGDLPAHKLTGRDDQHPPGFQEKRGHHQNGGFA